MKNLEEEYKNSEQEEMPDLWDRIEAGLPEKKKPVFFMSVNRYWGIAAVAAVLLLVGSAGLWSGRQLPKNNTSNLAMDMTMQNGAAAPPMDNAGEMYENEEAPYSPIMQDGSSDSAMQEDILESADEVNAQTPVGGMPVEDAEMGKTTALSEKEALALLGVYLVESGVLPPEREAYGTGEGERPGYTWDAISENDGEPVHMFLEFYSLDGSYLLFKMGERKESGEADTVYRTYSVHTLTGAITEEQ